MKNEKTNVLIVDDDVSIGEMLRTLLEFNGFEAVVINTPKQIEEKIEDYNIDIILLDMRLSGVKGTDVCTRLKQDERTREVPVLMMSALSDAAKECKAAGADGFISKPFEMDDLLSQINKVVAH